MEGDRGTKLLVETGDAVDGGVRNAEVTVPAQDVLAWYAMRRSDVDGGRDSRDVKSAEGST
jgi:hypothetical protein